jgi:eukaryotic-like serine/threonine-protein kinase
MILEFGKGPAEDGGEVPPAMTFEAGMPFGPYSLLERIGAGGMGEVWRARDPRLDRDVAIKVLPPSFAEDPGRVRRFDLEARTLARLNHPNIVHVHDCGEVDGQFYLVMEHLQGMTLRQKLQEGPLAPRRALDLALQMGRGLAAAHEQGIVHRDLKPENLFLARDGRVKLLDFGLAKAAAPAPDTLAGTSGETLLQATLLTREGAMMGTVGYMSPEQIRGEAVDQRSDLFVFGVLLYEMLTGQAPFRGANAVDTLHAVLHLELPEGDRAPGLPPYLDRIVRRCLEKDRELRFHDSHDLVFALEQVVPDEVSGDPVRGGPPGGRTPSRPPARRGPGRTALLAGLVLLALLAAGAGWALRRAPEPAFLRLTPFPTVIFSARYLPDGRSLVYSGGVDGKTEELFLLPASGGQPYSLGVKGARALAVSPSGDIAILVRRVPFHSWGDLAVLSAAGGTPKKVMEDVGWAEWGPDGRSLVIQRRQSMGREAQSIVYQGRTVCDLPGGSEPDAFTLSPGKDRLAYLEQRATFPVLVVVGLDGKVRQRTVMHARVDHLLWTPEGLHAICGALDGSDGSCLARIDPATGRIRPLYRSMGGMTLYDGAPGTFLLTRTGKRESWIGFTSWRKPGAASETLLSWGYWAQKPLLSRDGSRLVFSSSPVYDASGKILFVDRQGEGPENAFTFLGAGTARALSADGDWLVTQVGNEGGDHVLHLAPTGAGEERALPGAWTELEDGCAFTPDRKRALIRGRRAGEGIVRSWLADLGDGSLRRLQGDVRGPISPDGRWAFLYAGGNMHYTYSLFDLATGETRSLPEAWTNLRPAAWHSDGRQIWMWRRKSRRGFPLEVWLGDPLQGTGQWRYDVPGPDLPSAYAMGAFAVSGDGSAYAYDYFYTSAVPTDLYALSGLR